MEIETLYGTLKSEMDKIACDRDLLKKYIKKLDVTGQELIYGLVVIHHKDADYTGIVCGGKHMKDGRLRFDLNNFPDELIKILIVFCDKHLTRMHEDMMRQDAI